MLLDYLATLVRFPVRPPTQKLVSYPLPFLTDLRRSPSRVGFLKSKGVPDTGARVPEYKKKMLHLFTVFQPQMVIFTLYTLF